MTTKPVPSCHPIESWGKNLPLGSKFFDIFLFFLGQGGEEVIEREKEKVFLGRTNTEGVFSCPRRTVFGCQINGPCRPEGDFTVADASIIDTYELLE